MSVALSILRSVDLFGTNFTLQANNQKTFKTYQGGLLTVLALCLVITCTLLFGQDFFLKKNPQAMSRFGLNKDGSVSYVPMDTQDFTIMWKFSSMSSPSLIEEEVLFFPSLSYEIFSNQETGEMIHEKKVYPKPKKCSETKAKLNPHLTNYDLSLWSCVDWEEVSEEIGFKAFLGGQWENDRLAFLKINFQTCEFDFASKATNYLKCTSLDKIQSQLEKQNQIISWVMPDYNYDSTKFNDPFAVQYLYNWTRVTSSLYLSRQNNFSVVNLEDDRGWIFEDLNTATGVHKHSVIDQFALYDKHSFEKDPNQFYTTMTFYFLREELTHFRKFIKIQELIANIGGIIKVIVIVFELVGKRIAGVKQNLSLTHYVSTVRPAESKHKDLSLNQSKNKLRGATVNEPLKRGQYTTFKLFLGNFLCGRDNKVKEVNKAVKHFYETIDAVSLFKRMKEGTNFQGISQQIKVSRFEKA